MSYILAKACDNGWYQKFSHTTRVEGTIFGYQPSLNNDWLHFLIIVDYSCSQVAYRIDGINDVPVKLVVGYG